jgi:endonuclease-3
MPKKKAAAIPAEPLVPETLEQKKLRAKKLLKGLAKAYPEAPCALHHASAYQLLTAVILSAQCTDVRVNMATPELFRQFPTAGDLALASQEDVERLVKPLGFFRAKAANIRGMAQGLVDRFDGEVPANMDDLTSLPGVGRKTANVVLGTWFEIPSGVVVDTHVKRISYLFGLTESRNPTIIERELRAILPRNSWIEYSHRVIHHGRKICIARRPRCLECSLLKNCRRVGLPPLDEEAETGEGENGASKLRNTDR